MFESIIYGYYKDGPKMPRANEMIKLYTRVWKKLDKITPLPIDCGKLCDKNAAVVQIRTECCCSREKN